MNDQPPENCHLKLDVTQHLIVSNVRAAGWRRSEVKISQKGCRNNKKDENSPKFQIINSHLKNSEHVKFTSIVGATENVSKLKLYVTNK